MKISVDRPVECQYCPRTFRNTEHLKSHAVTHTAPRPHKCQICKQTFNRQYDLNTHIFIHHHRKSFHCPQCKEVFAQKNELMAHIRSHIMKPYPCSECDMNFSQKSDMMSHLVTHSRDKLFKCNDCPKSFKVKNSLIHHLQIHSEQKRYRVRTVEKLYKCENCKKSENFSTHNKKERQNCQHCYKSFILILTLIKNSTTEKNKLFKCDHCDKSFAHKKKLKEHIFNHSIMSATVSSEETFTSVESPKKQISNCTTKEKQNETDKGPYKCEFCFTAFTNLTDVIPHIINKCKNINGDVTFNS